MMVSCRECRGEIKSSTWDMHEGCTNLLSEERIEGTQIEAQPEGRIYCGQCRKVLGRFKWRGAQCMCGKWVFPYISIHKSRADIRK